VGKYEQLHGILMLLKPNEARLTVNFEYCVLELLGALHKSASKNLLFVLTNSRSTFYQPGDTMVPLRKLLNDLKEHPPYVSIEAQLEMPGQTMFCLDSESFRYLAAVQQGVKFQAADDNDFKVSWEKSVDCCRAILQRVQGIEGHATKDTVSLNEARQNILKLREPLALISTKISETIKLQQERVQDIMNMDLRRDDLNSKLFRTVASFDHRPLDEPNTVCTHADCTKILKDAEGNNAVAYVQRCHAPCYLSGVEAEKYPNTQLVHCYCMRGDKWGTSNATCAECGHTYDHHMHVMWEPVDTTVKIKDESVASMLNSTLSDRDKLQKIVEHQEKLAEEMKQERDKLASVMAEFAHFLAHSGISPINRAFESYIDFQIKNAETLEARRRHDGDQSKKHVIEGLKNIKFQYQQQREILEKEMVKAEKAGAKLNVLSPEEVASRQKELFALPHFGEDIKKAAQSFEQSSAVVAEQEEKVVAAPALTRGRKVRGANNLMVGGGAPGSRVQRGHSEPPRQRRNLGAIPPDPKGMRQAARYRQHEEAQRWADSQRQNRGGGVLGSWFGGGRRAQPPPPPPSVPPYARSTHAQPAYYAGGGQGYAAPPPPPPAQRYGFGVPSAGHPRGPPPGPGYHDAQRYHNPHPAYQHEAYAQYGPSDYEYDDYEPYGPQRDYGYYE